MANKSNEWEKVGMVPAWNFKDVGKGAEIIGVFLRKEAGIGENNSNMYILKTDEGDRAIWGNAVLDVRFKNLTPGEEVKVVYLGTEKSEKTKRDYHNFDVFHRPAPFVSVSEDIEEGDLPPF